MTSAEEYETLEKIGHGSFGVIRKVRRKTDGFVMCRKEISYLRMSQKEREQLHAEFQILSTLRHPNIVAYYHREHLKMSQDLHLYMEYCGNGDLGRVIKDLQHKGQRAPESFVWSIFSQLTLALYRCHYGSDPPEVGTNVLGFTQGTTHGAPKVPAGTMTILHRDLKPENVFLDDDNSVKLGDFGLSKMIKSHDFASTYVGTPFYMSPEICAAENYTHKSDIWSLGCIIYELCSREPPFNAKTHVQLVQKIKDGKIAPLPDMYSPDLFQAIKECLRVNPDRRPDTAQLLNKPIVKLMRKEKEVADLNKDLEAREASISKKEKDIDGMITRQRDEIELALRREWEVKAALEIDRRVKMEVDKEMERLHSCFESEVEARVALRVEVPAHGDPSKPEPVQRTTSDPIPKHLTPPEEADTPDDSHRQREALPKKTSRTPFARAQTMAAVAPPTPMDVEMASPSPIAIASLSLSPRRTGATKAPSRPEGNIFRANNNGNARKIWDGGSDTDLTPEDSEDEETFVPSPTRNVKSSKNPFTAHQRPVLTSQKSCPINRVKPPTTQTTTSGMTSKKGLVAPTSGPASPTRRLTKIPSAANLQGRGENSAQSSRTDEALSKVAAKANIKGRTLVELQQARAGGRPVSRTSGTSSGNESGSNLNTSPKRRMERAVSVFSGEPPATWDPETDEMPSPFIIRSRRQQART